MTDNAIPLQIDPYSPPQIAERLKTACVAKSKLSILQLVLLGILAGSFIGIGAMLYTNTMVGFPAAFGIKKLIGGLTFSIGLILVVIAGAELFTGNNLIVIATLAGHVSIARLLRNWFFVYVGNLIGSLLTAGIYFLTDIAQGNSELGKIAVKIAYAKTALPVSDIFFRAILCNALVCMAVWLCISARSNTDKILSIVFPITAFVALGFEHCVANMYFISFGYALQHFSGVMPQGVGLITISGMTKNIAVSTIGNIIGGSVLVAVVYWAIYLKPKGYGRKFFGLK